MKDAQTLWSKISADVLDKMSSCRAVQLKAKQRSQDKYEMDKLSVLYLALVNKASNKIATARNIGKEEGLAEGLEKGKLENQKLPWNMVRSK